MRFRNLTVFLGISMLVSSLDTALSRADEVDQLLAKVRAVGPKGRGHPEAIKAQKQLAALNEGRLVQLLAGFDQANPLARNWLRGAVETVAQRALEAGRDLPVNQLEAFIRKTSGDPHARRLAYELLREVDTTAEQRLTEMWLNDPSLELRRDAVRQRLDAAATLAARGSAQQAIAQYRAALEAARDTDQIESATKALRDMQQTVDVAHVFGFVQHWWLIGPFDNSNKRGFDVAYPPEKRIDLSESYSGKSQAPVKWVEHTTENEMGIVDLNEALDKHMGAIAYAYAEFYSAEEREGEVRLGCINGNKVWWNGELITANHVYHANTFVDQYSGKIRIKAGKNSLLVKVAQNEQTESWAQRWQFQLRVCGPLGGALHSSSPRTGKSLENTVR